MAATMALFSKRLLLTRQALRIPGGAATSAPGRGGRTGSGEAGVGGHDRPALWRLKKMWLVSMVSSLALKELTASWGLMSGSHLREERKDQPWLSQVGKVGSTDSVTNSFLASWYFCTQLGHAVKSANSFSLHSAIAPFGLKESSLIENTTAAHPSSRSHPPRPQNQCVCPSSAGNLTDSIQLTASSVASFHDGSSAVSGALAR